MTEIKYSAFVFIPKTTEVSLEDAERKIRTFFGEEKFPETNIEVFLSNDKFLNNFQLILKVDDWSIYIILNSDIYVSEEAIEIAEKYSLEDINRQASLKNCNSRFEVYSDTDPNMYYFNFYIWVVELLCEYEGALAFDPISFYFM
jgi:hypothetical protein